MWSLKEERKRFPSILLIDGSNLVYRAYHAFKKLVNSEGYRSGTLYGFIYLLKYYSSQFNTNCIIVNWDSENSWRKGFFEGYKQRRSLKRKEDEEAQEKHDGFGDCFDFCKACGIISIKKDQYEADDLITTFVKMFLKNILIVSDDKDFFQLVSDKRNVRVVRASHFKAGSQYNEYDEAEIERKFGVSVSLLPDYFSLCGDSVDEIPSVDGFGPKTAQKFVKKYKYEEFGKVLDEEQMSTFDRNLILIRLHNQIPIGGRDLVSFKKPDMIALKELFKKREIRKYGGKQVVRTFYNPNFIKFFLRSIVEHAKH